MKKSTIFTKIIIILLVLANINVCKKDETTVATTPAASNDVCKISKIDFGGGEYETYSFNSSGFMTKFDSYYKDANGKIQPSSSSYTYDASGLVVGSSYKSGSEK